MRNILKLTDTFIDELKNIDITSENQFSLEYGNKNNRNSIIEKIKNKVGEKSGVYIYSLDEKVVYVGKAKSLFSRIKCHYEESIFEAHGEKLGIAGDSKKGLYPAFFNKELKDDQAKYRVTITWIEVDSEFKRRLIEDALHLALEPTFIKFQKDYKRFYIN